MIDEKEPTAANPLEGSFFHRVVEDARADWSASMGEGFAPGLSIGDFRLVRLLGRGGMGEVWEAVQKPLDRSVALKLLLPERMNGRSIDYFAREARAAGKLSHPDIVPIFGAGVDGGTHWIAMELVPGGATLGHFIEDVRSRNELPAGYHSRVAELVARVADALQAAHDAGVIHRDLKPHNVIITAADEPRVVDFGLARLEDERELSQTGDLAGTYYYMSPEQVMARRMGIDHRTDVFSLGVVLYELLTLQRPFDGDTMPQIAQKIVMDDPPDPRAVRSKTPLDLAVIAGKALEKKPDARYPSMAELAADLRRHLAHEPIRARPPSPVRRAGKWVRRNPAKSAAGGVASLAFVAIAALLLDNLRTNRDLRESRRGLESANLELRVERDQARAVSAFLEEDFISAVKPSADEGRGRDVLLRDVVDRAAQKVEDRFIGQPEVEARIRDTLGRTYMALGELDLADSHLLQTLSLRRENLGDEHPDTLGSAGDLGSLRDMQGHMDEAVTLLREALEGQRRLLGDDHPDTLWSLNALGAVLVRGREFELAEPLLREALEGRLRTLGADHIQVLSTSVELANSLWMRGDVAEAERLHRDTLEACRRVLGDDHRLTAAVAFDLASLLGDQRRLDEAEPYLMEALEINRRILGDDHPHTLTTVQTLGMLAKTLGRAEEALVHMSEALQGQRRILGDAHPATLFSMFSLAEIYLDTGRLGEAKLLARELVERTPESAPSRANYEGLLDLILRAEAAAGEPSTAELEEP